MELTIEQIQKLCHDESIIMTQHTLIRCQERKIRYSDIKNAILSGEVIEKYPDDYPYPSCLILGITLGIHYLHVVCGIGDNKLWIITSYFPSLEKWEPDLKTRKVVD